MSLLGRNSNPPDQGEQAVPAAPPPPPKKSGGGNPLAGLRQWLIDSYNGLYKVVLEPSMPTKQTVMIVVVGIIIGLIWGYGVSPTVFFGANPNRLNDAAQEQWVRMVAVGADSTAEYNEQSAADLLSRIPDPIGKINLLLNDPNTSPEDRNALSNLLSMIPQDLQGAPAITPPGIVMDILGLLIPIIAAVIVTPILVVVWRLLIQPNIFAPMQSWVQERMDPEVAERNRRARSEIKIMQEQRKLRDQMKTEVSTDMELGEPVMQYLSIYTPDRNYDDSVEIELPLEKGGDFLGQCGAVLAEAVDPDPIAVEVWLFDMFSQQNLKRIFVTEAGYNDPAIRSRLEGDVASPADVILAAPGATVNIDSDKLRLQGKMTSVTFNPNGRFQEFNMQLRAWQKSASKPAGGANMPPPMPAAAPMPAAPAPLPTPKPLPDYSDIQFDPPPPMPSNPAPSQQSFAPPPPIQPLGGSGLGGMQPLSPPPMNRPQGGGLTPLTPPPLGGSPADRNDDDPFGGTGDFTPLPRK